MKNLCKDITFDQLKKGQFIIIICHGRCTKFIIAKVITDQTNETIEINEIGESESDRPHFDEIDKYFILHDCIFKKVIFKKDDELILEPSGSSRISIFRMIVVGKKTLKEMAQKTVTEKEDVIKNLQEKNAKFKTAMETVGLLKKQVEK